MTKPAADLATPVKPEDLAPPVKLPTIDPRNCHLQADGQGWKELFVRLPENFTANDLNARPEAWVRVQGGGQRALRKFDRIVAVAWDESWLAEAIVSEAHWNRVFFAKPKITTFGDRYEVLLADENYKVEWVGTGYAVRRLKDGVLVTQPVHSVALAERDLRGMYPRSA